MVNVYYLIDGATSLNRKVAKQVDSKTLAKKYNFSEAKILSKIKSVGYFGADVGKRKSSLIVRKNKFKLKLTSKKISDNKIVRNIGFVTVK